jgi:signal transduction histidine kinase
LKQKMAEQSKSSGISRQVLIVIFAVLLTVAVNIFWWLYYGRTKAQFSSLLDARLSSLAIAGTALLTDEDIGKLLVGDVDVYLKTLDYIDRLTSADSVSEVFVVDQDFRIVISSQLESDSFYLLADLNGAALDSVFHADWQDAGISAVVTHGYRVDNLILKTAFAPLFDTSGFVVAALAVEADVNYTATLSRLRKNLMLSTAASVIAAIIFAGLFLVIQRRLAGAERSVLRAESEMNLGRMVAVVSHEIKNPLSILRSAAERILKKTEMKEAGFLIDEVDRLDKIVRGYLDFARSPDRIALNYVALETILNDLREMAGQLRPRMQTDGVELTTIIPPTVGGETKNVTALIDTAALRQVVMNLILNGADAAKQALAQDKTDTAQAELRLSVEVSDGKLAIHVQDNGMGISEKLRKRLFEPFYTTKQHGSGLGLYLCQQLVERMKGAIDVASSDGGPTRFTVTLPLSTQSTARALTKHSEIQSTDN